MKCDFVEFDDAPLPDGRRRVKCSRCGIVTAPTIHPLDRVVARCSAVPRGPILPPLHKRLANFTRAAIEHAKAGSPTCTQEQIDERHGICMACDIYLPSVDNPAIGNCTHSSCGCPVTRLDKFVSKLAWADQECPLGKWPAIEAPTK